LPLYEYLCPKCGRFELIRKFSDATVTICPTCGSEVQKLLSAPAIQFKGTGWYITDYARKSDGKGGKGEGAKGEGAKSEGGKSEGGKSEGGKSEGGTSESAKGAKDSGGSSETKTASTTTTKDKS
jgi:putative FmdB family regulatory protein